MWGWLQERRKVGSYDYAGCLSLPRVLYLRGDRLIQVCHSACRGCWVLKRQALDAIGMVMPALRFSLSVLALLGVCLRAPCEYVVLYIQIHLSVIVKLAMQEPAPEITQLRRGDAWHAHHLKLFPEEVTPLEGVAGPAIEVQCTIER